MFNNRCKLKRIQRKRIGSSSRTEGKISLAFLFKYIKTISKLLIIAFIALDISWAYPVDRVTENNALATYSLFQRGKMPDDVSLQVAVHSIAMCLLGDPARNISPLPIKYLKYVLSSEAGHALKGVNLSDVSIGEDNIIIVPYYDGTKKRTIRIAMRNNPASENMPGDLCAISDRYIAKSVPENYKAPAAQKLMPARAPMPRTWARASTPRQSASGQGSGEDLIKELSSCGDINYWDEKIAEEARENNAKTEIRILLERGENRLKVITFELPDILFSGKDASMGVRYLAASLYNELVCEGATSAVIFMDDKKKEARMADTIRSELQSNYERMPVYANFGDSIEIHDSGNFAINVRKEVHPELDLSSSAVEGKYYIGVDTGGTNIKTTLMLGNKAIYQNSVGVEKDRGGAYLKNQIIECLGTAKKELEKRDRNAVIESVGLTFPSSIKNRGSESFKVVRLTNFERFWSEQRGGSTDFTEDYEELNSIGQYVHSKFGIADVFVLNDADAFGFGEIYNRIKNGEDPKEMGAKVVLPIGTGPGYVKIKDGLIEDIPNQGGHMVIDMSESAEIDEGCGVKGCYGAYVPASAFALRAKYHDLDIRGRDSLVPRDINNVLKLLKDMADRIATEAVKVHKVTGANEVILAGGISQGWTGEELCRMANKIIRGKYPSYLNKIRVTISESDLNYGGAIGAARYAMAVKDAAQRKTAWKKKYNLPQVDIGKNNIEKFFKENAREKFCVLTTRELFGFMGQKGYPWFGNVNCEGRVLFLENFNTPEELIDAIKGKDASCIVAIGAGTVTDWAKFTGKKLGAKVVSVPSALSGNGMFTEKAIFYSGTGDKRKRVSEESGSPDKAIIDLNFLRDMAVFNPTGGISGERTMRAGSGDIVSIFIALLDWELAAKNGREPVDTVVYNSARDILRLVVDNAEDIKNNSDLGMTVLAEAMAEASLLNMRYGTSRPKDGSEHLLGDEIDRRLPKETPRLHCEVVAIASLIMGYLYSTAYDPKPYLAVKGMIKALGLPTSPEEIGATREVIIDAMMNVGARPDKYTFFDRFGEGISREDAEAAYERVFGSRRDEIDEFTIAVSYYVNNSVKAMFSHITDEVIPNLDSKKTKELLDLLVETKKRGGRVMINAAGRVGEVAVFFQQKLRALGFHVDDLKEITPEFLVDENDLVLTFSGSGTTASVVNNLRNVDTMHRMGKLTKRIFSITASPDAPVWKTGQSYHTVMEIKGRSKDAAGQKHVAEGAEYLPLSSTFEYSVMLYLEGIIEALTKDGTEISEEEALKIIKEVVEKTPASIKKEMKEQLLVNEPETARFIDLLLSAIERNEDGSIKLEGDAVRRTKKRIYLFGLGQNNYVIRLFARRMQNIGFDVYVPGPRDIVSRPRKGDVTIFISNSGARGQMEDKIVVADEWKCSKVLITAAPHSPLANMADIIIPVSRRTTVAHTADIMKDKPEYKEERDVKRTFEIASMFYLEGISVALMKILGVKEEDLEHVPKQWELKGPQAPESNPEIAKIIAEGRMVELAVEGSRVKAYQVNYINGYEPGVLDPVQYRGPPRAIMDILSKDEAVRLAAWMKSHSVKGEPVKFRVALDSAALGWNGDAAHSNIAHAGFRDRAIYIGSGFLAYLFTSGNEALREEVLDKDEFRHLFGLGHGTEDEYGRRLEVVGQAIEDIVEKTRASTPRQSASGHWSKYLPKPIWTRRIRSVMERDVIGRDLVVYQRLPLAEARRNADEFVETIYTIMRQEGAGFRNAEEFTGYLKKRFGIRKFVIGGGKGTRFSPHGIMLKQIYKPDGSNTQIKLSRMASAFGMLEDVVIIDAITAFKILRDDFQITGEIKDNIYNNINDILNKLVEEHAIGSGERDKVFNGVKGIINNNLFWTRHHDKLRDLPMAMALIARKVNNIIEKDNISSQFVTDKITYAVFKAVLKEINAIDETKKDEFFGRNCILVLDSGEGHGSAYAEALKELKDSGKLDEARYSIIVYADSPGFGLDRYPNAYFITYLKSVNLISPKADRLPKVTIAAKNPQDGRAEGRGRIFVSMTDDRVTIPMRFKEWNEMTKDEQGQSKRMAKKHDTNFLTNANVFIFDTEWAYANVKVLYSRPSYRHELGKVAEAKQRPHEYWASDFINIAAGEYRLLTQRNAAVSPLTRLVFIGKDAPDATKTIRRAIDFNSELQEMIKKKIESLGVIVEAGTRISISTNEAGLAFDWGRIVSDIFEHGSDDPIEGARIKSLPPTRLKGCIHLDDTVRVKRGAILDGTGHDVFLVDNCVVERDVELQGVVIDREEEMAGLTERKRRFETSVIRKRPIEFILGGLATEAGETLVSTRVMFGTEEETLKRFKELGFIVDVTTEIYLVKRNKHESDEKVLARIFGERIGDRNVIYQIYLSGKVILDERCKVENGTWLDGREKKVVLMGRTCVGRGVNMKNITAYNTRFAGIRDFDIYHYSQPRHDSMIRLYNSGFVRSYVEHGACIENSTVVRSHISRGAVVVMSDVVDEFVVEKTAIRNRWLSDKEAILEAAVEGKQKYVPGIYHLEELGDQDRKEIKNYQLAWARRQYNKFITDPYVRKQVFATTREFMQSDIADRFTPQQLRYYVIAKIKAHTDLDERLTDLKNLEPLVESVRTAVTGAMEEIDRADITDTDAAKKLFREIAVLATRFNIVDFSIDPRRFDIARLDEAVHKNGSAGFNDLLDAATKDRLGIDGLEQFEHMVFSPEKGIFLYFTDNIGEAEADALIWNFLAKMGHTVVIAPKNDFFFGDINVAGVEDIIRSHSSLREYMNKGKIKIVECGSPGEGVFPHQFNKDITRIFKQGVGINPLRAIISKGQANLFTLAARNNMKVPFVAMLLSKTLSSEKVTGVPGKTPFWPLIAVIPKGRHVLQRTNGGEFVSSFKDFGKMDEELARQIQEGAVPPDTGRASTPRQSASGQANGKDVFAISPDELLNTLNKGFLIPHVERATAINTRIGEAMGLPEGQLKVLKYASLLHDVGAAVRGRHEEIFFDLSGKIRMAFPDKPDISVKNAVDLLINREAEDEGVNTAELKDTDIRYRLFRKGVAVTLGRPLDADEEEVAYSIFDVPLNSLRILKERGIAIPRELEIVIRYHNDYRAFMEDFKSLPESGMGLDMSKSDIARLITILYLTDIFEHGNNKHTQLNQRKKERVEYFPETIEFIEKKFNEIGVREFSDRQPLASLIRLLCDEDKVIINTVLRARESEELSSKDLVFIENNKKVEVLPFKSERGSETVMAINKFRPGEIMVYPLFQENMAKSWGMMRDKAPMHFKYQLEGRDIQDVPDLAPDHEHARKDVRTLREYLNKFTGRYNALEVVGFVGNGNVLANSNLAAYCDGKIHAVEQEKELIRNGKSGLYPSLIVWKDGHFSIEEVSFTSDNQVIQAATGKKITDDVVVTNSGIGMLKDGQPYNLAEHYKHDSDVRHYIDFPFIRTANVHFGVSQFYDENGEVVEKLIVPAIQGIPVVLKLEERGRLLTEAEIRELEKGLGEKGYNRIISSAHDVAYGEYFVDLDLNNITIGFARGINPHNICGIDKDGNLVSIVVAGKSNRSGTTFMEAQKKLKEMGICDAIIFDNGADAMMNVSGYYPIPSFTGRDRLLSVLVFARPITQKIFKNSGVVPSYTVDRDLKLDFSKEANANIRSGMETFSSLFDIAQQDTPSSFEVSCRNMKEVAAVMSSPFYRKNPTYHVKRVGENLTNLASDKFESVITNPQCELSEIVKTLEPSYVSVHLAWSAEDIELSAKDNNNHDVARSLVLDRDELLKRMVKNINILHNTLKKSGYDKPVLLEPLNYHKGGAYEHITDPKFIRELLKQTGAGLLIDCGHILVSAKNNGIYSPERYMDYVKAVIDDETIGLVGEIHLSVPKAMPSGQYEDMHRPLYTKGIESREVIQILKYIIDLRARLNVNHPIIVNFETGIENAGRELKQLADELSNARASISGVSEESTGKIQEALFNAAALNLQVKRPLNQEGKPGQLIEIKDAERVRVIGDFHTESYALDKVMGQIENSDKELAKLKEGKLQVVLTGDYIQTLGPDDFVAFCAMPGYWKDTYNKNGDLSADALRVKYDSEYKKDWAIRAYELLLEIAALKIKYPNSFHILPGNAEVGIMFKSGRIPLINLAEENGTLGAMESFLDSMPLYARVEMNGKRYLVSHGGVADIKKPFSRAALINFERGGVEKAGKPKEGAVRPTGFDEDNMKQLSFAVNGTKKDKDGNPIDVKALVEALSNTKDDDNMPVFDYQIFGHIHLFGAGKNTEVPALGCRLLGPGISKAIAHDKFFIVNSIDMEGLPTFFDIPGDIGSRASVPRQSASGQAGGAEDSDFPTIVAAHEIRKVPSAEHLFNIPEMRDNQLALVRYNSPEGKLELVKNITGIEGLNRGFEELLAAQKGKGKTYIITSDTHGTTLNVSELRQTLHDFPDEDVVMMIGGDWVDRGPAWLVPATWPNARTLVGNHDIWFMMAALGREDYIAHALLHGFRYGDEAMANLIRGLGIDKGLIEKFKEYAEKDYRDRGISVKDERDNKNISKRGPKNEAELAALMIYLVAIMNIDEFQYNNIPKKYILPLMNSEIAGRLGGLSDSEMRKALREEFKNKNPLDALSNKWSLLMNDIEKEIKGAELVENVLAGRLYDMVKPDNAEKPRILVTHAMPWALEENGAPHEYDTSKEYFEQFLQSLKRNGRGANTDNYRSAGNGYLVKGFTFLQFTQFMWEELGRLHHKKRAPGEEQSYQYLINWVHENLSVGEHSLLYLRKKDFPGFSFSDKSEYDNWIYHLLGIKTRKVDGKTADIPEEMRANLKELYRLDDADYDVREGKYYIKQPGSKKIADAMAEECGVDLFVSGHIGKSGDFAGKVLLEDAEYARKEGRGGFEDHGTAIVVLPDGEIMRLSHRPFLELLRDPAIRISVNDAIGSHVGLTEMAYYGWDLTWDEIDRYPKLKESIADLFELQYDEGHIRQRRYLRGRQEFQNQIMRSEFVTKRVSGADRTRVLDELMVNGKTRVKLIDEKAETEITFVDIFKGYAKWKKLTEGYPLRTLTPAHAEQIARVSTPRQSASGQANGMTITADSYQAEADRIAGAIITLARRAQREGEKLIVGFETDWIPGYNERGVLQRNALNPLIIEIESLQEKLRSMGIDNVEIVHKKSYELAAAILEKADENHTKLENVVVLASTGTINSRSFTPLRSTNEEKRAFLAAINPEELYRWLEANSDSPLQLDVKITKLLLIALELALGKDPPQIPIIVYYDKKLRMVIFLPRAELVDCSKFIDINKARKAALRAA